jgi:hypothetical protein
MAYSKAKLRSSGDKTPPCFRPFQIEKLSYKIYKYTCENIKAVKLKVM